MTANAVANYLEKRVLLVTVSLLLDKDLTKVSEFPTPKPHQEVGSIQRPLNLVLPLKKC